MNRAVVSVLTILAAGVTACAAETATPDNTPRHLIYLHGRIVQDQQSRRPQHPEFGTYELDEIESALEQRGFVTSAEVRPRAATVSESADRVVAQVRNLLASGVPAERITVVGGSMGASIALLASARLRDSGLRFAVLGACLEPTARELIRDEGHGPSGHVLAIREASDDIVEPCADWSGDLGSPDLEVREIRVDTGLGHGFLYRPLPEWLEPVVEWAGGDATKPSR